MNGKPYRIDWPEYFVDCADCEQSAMISELGVCNTIQEAEKRATVDCRKLSIDISGWRRIEKLWYCPEHV